MARKNVHITVSLTIRTSKSSRARQLGGWSWCRFGGGGIRIGCDSLQRNSKNPASKRFHWRFAYKRWTERKRYPDSNVGLLDFSRYTTSSDGGHKLDAEIKRQNLKSIVLGLVNREVYNWSSPECGPHSNYKMLRNLNTQSNWTQLARTIIRLTPVF